jgi:quinol monooxygenase YgiN
MSAPVVRMTVHWSVPVGETRPMTAALHTLMVTARAERGCLACSLSTEMGEKATLHYVQDWATEDDLRRQLRSDWFVSFAALMERATSRPDIEFSLHGDMRGLDYVDEVRRRPES